MKSGTYSIDFGTDFNDLLNSQKGEQKLNIAFQSAWNAYTYDNMDVFYIDVEKLTLYTTTTTIGTTARVYATIGKRTAKNSLKHSKGDDGIGESISCKTMQKAKSS